MRRKMLAELISKISNPIEQLGLIAKDLDANQTNEYYVDGSAGDDSVADGREHSPFKTIQACLNFIGQPTSKTDYMRHILIYISDKISASAGNSPQTWNGVYEENLVVPSRCITFVGAGVKIGSNGGHSGFGNILKEYSSSRRFGAGSADFRPAVTFIGAMNCRDNHNRLRNGFHIEGNCRTAILKRNFDFIQGSGTNRITVHIAAGQNLYPITVPINYPAEPYIRIAVSGTTYYNGVYDITSKIDETHFEAKRISGSNAHTETETSGSFFESDSAGSSGLTHDAAFVNCYMMGQYTCDDGTVNGAAPTAGTEVLYSVNTKFYTGIEGRGILIQRCENSSFTGPSIVSSIASMFNSSFSGALTLSSFTYSTDDMGFMSCRFNSALVFTVNGAGQTVRMDGTTYKSFLKSGSSWAVNTPTVDLLDLEEFVSTLQTGNASEQSVSHGLGRIPTRVLISVYDSGTGVFSVVEGTHTTTVVKVTVTSGVKYKVYAK
jgi:hypothetical protein